MASMLGILPNLIRSVADAVLRVKHLKIKGQKLWMFQLAAEMEKLDQKIVHFNMRGGKNTIYRLSQKHMKPLFTL